MNNPNFLDDRALAREHLNKAINFQKMGMAASAERELAEARRLDSTITSALAYQSMQAQAADQRTLAEARKWPMRVAAGMLLTDAGVFALLWLINLAAGQIGQFLLWGLVHIGFDVFIAINLLRGKETAIRSALYWAGVGAVFGLIAAVASGSAIDVILQLAYSGALLILLLGRPSKVRMVIAIVVYVVGYLGSLCGFFAWSILSPFLTNL